jgi:hypothetical protein
VPLPLQRRAVEELRAAHAHSISLIEESDGRLGPRCPGHDDQHASLSLRVGEDGRTLLHCHAGCSGDSVLEATVTGLTMADLRAPRDVLDPPRRIIATDRYCDESGTHLYDVVRYAPKEFLPPVTIVTTEASSRAAASAV